MANRDKLVTLISGYSPSLSKCHGPMGPDGASAPGGALRNGNRRKVMRALLGAQAVRATRAQAINATLNARTLGSMQPLSQIRSCRNRRRVDCQLPSQRGRLAHGPCCLTADPHLCSVLGGWVKHPSTPGGKGTRRKRAGGPSPRLSGRRSISLSSRESALGFDQKKPKPA